MRPDQTITRNQRSGFTLMETLVALGVASILIATPIPVSRNTLFRALKLADASASLPALERAIQSSANGRFERTSTDNGVNVTMTKRALPPFLYDKEEKRPWQPVLVTIETRTPAGAVERVEVIRLEQGAP